MTLSEMKFTITPALTNQATKAMPPTSSAVPAARALNRVASPPAIWPSDAPISNEMAEVTETTVCRELQNSQNTKPDSKQAYNPASGGRFANEASPRAAGSKYA